MIANAKKVFAACESTLKNAFDFKFEENLLYDKDSYRKICAKTLTLIDSDKYVESWDGSCCKIEFKNTISEVCGMCKVGHKYEDVN